MKRRPLAYLLITVSILSIGSVLVVEGLKGAYSEIAGIPKSAIPDLNRFLIILPALVLWIPIAFWLSSCFLSIIFKLRGRAEEHATLAKKLNYAGSQKRLVKLVLAFAAVCVPLIVAGFMLKN